LSQTIDQKVVEMRFDNKNFESNVKTSLSTLQRLKQALHLKGASKGLDDISSAAKKVNMSNLGASVDTVRVKFSALQMVAMSALNNITNSVMQVGKNIVSTFTIDPIKSGLSEYETQINAIQTILANTSSKGTTLDQINSALDELNHYADKTIYNFTEMTKNIGTFTAAGIDLETSVSAIQGIANLAAVSGSTSTQASTAMYQLSQALASGTVKLMDWNSVVNAGMGGEVFQNALKETAKAHGVAVDEIIEKQGSFRESLSEGWITSEILTETLSKMTKSGAAEYLSELTGIEAEQITAAQELADKNKGAGNAYDELTDKMAATGKVTKDQAQEILEMADTAEDAATKVKTFSQLWDTLKEAAQSGWTQSWEYIIGDFEQAKTLWTGVSDTLSEMINNSADARNSVLKDAMSSGWDKFVSALTEAGATTDELQTKISSLVGEEKLSGLIEEYGSLEKVFQKGALSSDVLKQALSGLKSEAADLSKVTEGLSKASKYDTGAGDESVKQLQQALEDAGHSVGDYGIDGLFGSGTEAALKAFQEAQGLEVTGIVDEATLSALKEATSNTRELTDAVYDLIPGITEVGGREYLIQGLSNAWKGLLSVVKPIKAAFNDIFPSLTGDQIRDALKKFSELTAGMKLNYKQAKQLRWVFKGLFSVFGLVGDTVKTGVLTAFKGLKGVLKSTNLPILEIASSAGKALYQFRSWVNQNGLIQKGFDKIGDVLGTGVEKIREWYAAFKAMPEVQAAMETVKTAFTDAQSAITEFVTYGTGPIANFGKAISNFASDIWNLDAVQTVVGDIKTAFGGAFTGVSDFFAGGAEKIQAFIERIKSLKDIKLSDVGDILTDFKDNVLDYFLTFGDRFESFGETIKAILDGVNGGIASFVSGIANFVSGVGSALLDARDAIVQWGEDSGINWGVVLALVSIFGGITAMAKTVLKIIDTAKNLLTPIASGIKDIVKTVQNAINALSKAKVFEMRTEGLFNIAKSIIVIAAAIALLGKLDQGELIQGGVAVGVITGVLVGLSLLSSKLNALDMVGTGLAIKNVGKSLLLLAVAAKILGGMDIGDMVKAGIAIGVFVACMKSIIKSTKGLGGDLGNANDIGKMMQRFAKSIIVMAVAMKLIGGMSVGELTKGLIGIGVMLAMMKSVMKQTSSFGEFSVNADKVGKMMSKFAVAMLLMTASVKLLGGMDTSEMIQGMAGVIAIMGMFSVMMKSSSGLTANTGPIIAMAAAVGVIAIAIYSLTALTDNTADAILAATSIAEVMLAMSLMFKTVSSYSGSWKSIAAPLGVMVVAVGLIGLILAGISALNPEGSLEIASSISELLVSMSAAALLLSKVGPISGEALAGAAKMMALVAAISAVLIIIGGLSEKFASGFLDEAIEGLGKIGYALGNFVGSIVGGFGAGATSGLPIIGENLAGFANAISGIDSGAAEAASNLANMMLKLTAANFIDGITSWLGIGDLSVFAGKCTQFATAMVEISNAITANGGIDTTAVEQATKAGELFNALATAIPKTGGLAQAVLGETDLETFGTRAKEFSEAMINASNALTTGDGINSDAVNQATEAGELFNALNLKLDKTGGLAQLFTGETNLETFGDRVVEFSEAMVSASNALTEGNGIDSEAVEKAKNAGDLMQELNDAVANTGDKNKLFEDSAFGSFADNVAAFGDAISELSGKSADLNVEGIGAAVGAAQGLVDIANMLDEDTLSKFDQFNTTSALTNFGAMMSDFNIQLGKDFSAENVQSAITAGLKLQELSSTLSGINFESFNIEGNLSGFGSALSELSSQVATINAGQISSSISQIVTAIQKANSVDVSNIDSFVSAVQKLGSTSVDSSALESTASSVSSSVSNMMSSMEKSISSSEDSMTSSMSSAMSGTAGAIDKTSSQTSAAATSLAKGVADAISAMAGAVTSAASNLVAGGPGAIRAYYGSFYSAGSMLGAGVATGLNSMLGAVQAAAAAIAAAANAALAAKAKIASPSKVWFQDAVYMAQGLINGLKSMRSGVSNEAGSVAMAANDAMSSTMSTLSSMLNMDLNSIQPTIRPVMDLSKVSAGVYSIDAMLNQTHQLGMTADIQAVNRSMSGRNQNGVNSDVVSAIDKLRKVMTSGNFGNTTNNNYSGITLNRGEDITEAFETIAHAVEIAGRM